MGNAGAVILAIVYGLLIGAAYTIAGVTPGALGAGIVAGFAFLMGWFYRGSWK